MKSLLLKEYLLIKRNRSLFMGLSAAFTMIVFALFSTPEHKSIFYPATFMVCALMPLQAVDSINYDSKSGFDQYGLTLPFSKKQLVSSKYAFGALCVVFALAMSAVIAAVFFVRGKYFDIHFPEFDVCLPFLVVFVGMFTISVAIPVSYRFGFGENAIFWIVMVLSASGIILITMYAIYSVCSIFNWKAVTITVGIIAAVCYPISWKLSMNIHTKYGVR